MHGFRFIRQNVVFHKPILCERSEDRKFEELNPRPVALGSGESHIQLVGTVSPPPPPPHPVISQITWPISKTETAFDSPVRELSKHSVKLDLEVTDDVTGQVKVRMFDFSGLVTSASTISMLSASKANESAWIVSLTFVSIISCALGP